MPSTRQSYRSRVLSATQAIHCERLGEDDGCWGDVTMTGHGYRCQGHRKASGYIPEPVPLTVAELAALRAKQEAEEARKEAEWQASRWFRPLVDDLPSAADEFYTKLSAPVLAAVFSMIGEGLTVGDASEKGTALLWEMGRHASAELVHRNQDWPLGYYELKLAPDFNGPGENARHPLWPMNHTKRGMEGYHSPFDDETLALDVSLLSDDHLMVLYGCAAQVVDYSCLERGARQVADEVWHVTEAELKRRGLRPEFLMDWEG